MIFAQDRTVWVGYKLTDKHYEYLSIEEQLDLHEKIEGFYWNVKTETHALVVPRFQRVEEPFNVFNIRLAPELKEEGKTYIKE